LQSQSTEKLTIVMAPSTGNRSSKLKWRGGFLGVGSRLVVLPFDAFKIGDSKIVLPNASKEQLKKFAEFKYVS
jgi:hypothetical protein